MKILEVFLRNELLWEYSLQTQEINIGRSKRNQIILPDPSVSRKHANITIEKDKLVVFDTSSTGTFVNSEKVISKRNLNKDDKISIGPYSLYFRKYNKKDQKSNFHETLIEETSTISLFVAKISNSFLLRQASILILNGPDQGKQFQINKEKFSFGKEKNNDLILHERQISNYHGEIRFSKGEFFIHDIGSGSGIFIGGKRIQGATLTSNTRIDIGKCCIEFVIKGADFSSSEKEDHLGNIIGKSRKIRETYTLIKKAASCDATVLISGETGTGKGLVAKTIHALSTRSKNPFITIDCGSIPPNLIESELFGHEKGAFTGAQSQRKGAFEQGHSGTVFLDEIGELSKDMQPKLLRIIEEREFKRVGGDKYIFSDIRVITATNKELNKDVVKGKFREDLFYRLYVVPIDIPPLRERKEDISFLAEHFIKQFHKFKGKKNILISDDALKKMEDYSWPGNIRELRNVIDRAMVQIEGNLITANEIKFAPIAKIEDENSFPSGTSLEEIERQTIIKALKSQNGNKKATAKILGIAYSTMCEKVKKYKITI